MEQQIQVAGLLRQGLWPGRGRMLERDTLRLELLVGADWYNLVQEQAVHHHQEHHWREKHQSVEHL